MRDTIAGVEDKACGASGRVEGKDGLDGGVEGGHVKGFEEDLCSCFAIRAWVQWRFCEEERVLQRSVLAYVAQHGRAAA